MRRHAKASTAGSIFARTGRAPVVVILSVVAMLLTASPALAIETHPFISNLGSANQPSFANAEGLAVDHATGDVLVVDAGVGTISRWHADGSAADFSALGTNVIDGQGSGDETPEGGLGFPVPKETEIAVDDSSGVTQGDIYVAQSFRHLIYIFSSSGEYLGKLDAAGSEGFDETCGVTVDSSGAVYVSDFSHGIQKFVPTANPAQNTDNTATFKTESPCNLGAGAGPTAGSIFVASLNTPNRITKLSATTGEAEYVVSPRSVGVMSVDPSNGHLYVAKEGEVVEYDVSSPFSPTQLTSLALDSEVQGIAAEGDLYLSSRHVAHVEVFGPTAALADAAVQKATAVERTAATLNGTIGAGGGPSTTCEFQYTSEEDFEAKGYEGAGTAPCAPAGPFTGTSTQSVSAAISGLHARTAYRFRLLGTNENGAHASTSLGFETKQPLSATTGKASNLAAATATLNATVNPEGLAVEECNFEYGEGTEPYEHTAPCAGNPADIGTGNEPKPVHADVSGLNPGATYHFRIVAKNSLGTATGKDFVFGPPLVKANSVAEITRISATIAGVVNPTGVETTYVVQYVTEGDFSESEFANATELPAGGEAIGSGAEDVKVSQQISGLVPHAVYYFRVLADSAAGTSAGPAKTFTTYVEGEAGLPDGRVYEQVTAVNKNGAAPSGGLNEVQAASDGSGIVFSSHGGLPGGEGSQQFPSFFARRGADWSTHGLLPPASQGSVGVVNGWSENLTQSFVTQAGEHGDPLSFRVRDNATGALRTIVGDGGVTDTFNYVDASADDSVVAFESRTPLLPGDASGFQVRNTYVWDRESGELRLAGVLNDGQPPVEGSLAGSNQGRPTDGSSNQYLNIHYTQAQNTLSADGSHIFFTGAADHKLYVRLNPTKPQSALNGEEECTEAAMACTIEVSASQRTIPDPFGEKPPAFMNATADGSQAFFTSSGKLTDNATTGLGDFGKDLYRYDVASGVLTDITVDSKDLFGPEVQGVLGTSDDGSYVYFAANAVLADGASAGNCKGITWSTPGTGECNLYLWHDGVITFVAPQQMAGGYRGADSTNWMSTGYSEQKSSRVTPDGKTLLFRARLKLTSYDNEEVPEFYRYSAEGGGLICVTCNPTGTPPADAGNPSVLSPDAPRLKSITQTAEAAFSGGVLTRNLSADGNRVFFDTAAKLVAEDTNGVRDVYEWEAKGSGSCASEDQNGGCLYLISTGTSQEPSYFGDASTSGDDAFVFTDQSLVGQDKDQIVDIYDARIGGGIASQNPPPPPDPCEGEACRQGVPAPPASQSAGSASFSGPDNPKPTRHTKKSKHKKKSHKAHKKQGKHKKSHASRKHG